MIKLTRKQFLWLVCNGDRSEEELQEDEEGLFVFMSDGCGNEVKVYLPDDNRLRTRMYGNTPAVELV